MNSFRRQVELAIRATVFRSNTYSWYSKSSPVLSPKIRRALTPHTQRNYLLFQLQSQLYRDFYCQGAAGPAREESGGLPAAGATPFVQALSDANSGEGYWDDGWTVRALDQRFVVACSERLELQAGFDECLPVRDEDLQIGTRLRLRYPKEFLGISPGFYMALSNKPLIDDISRDLVRIYWNITADGAVRFLRCTTSILNSASVPFRLKVLNDPTLYTRCDAAVLYFCKDDYPTVAGVLPGLYSETVSSLKQGTPVFTKPLAGGIGVAENPGEGSSFGLHRCGILADGMVRAHEEGKNTIAARMQAVEERFMEFGINLDRPYLNPESDDIYTVDSSAFDRSRLSVTLAKFDHTDLNAGELLRTADEIGQRLSREAQWHEGRCNWMGFIPDEAAMKSGLRSLKYAALGPELYSGTSGVALFLAELCAATGTSLARQAAIGAIRHAVSRLRGRSFSTRPGLYTGSLGIAVAAARAGKILREEELLHFATQIAQMIPPTMRRALKEPEFDVMSGLAGTISALLVLCVALEDLQLLDLADQFGDALLRMADRSDLGWSWASHALPSRQNLTGFSHGAAGAGYAMLELFRATGRIEYRNAAMQAFQYERHWFTPEVENWPDFREEPGYRRRGAPPLSFGTSWCHGAPGIALSRLRAYEILKDATCKSEAITAIQTTQGVLEGWLHSGTANFSLCHGLAGNAESLLYAYELLGDQMSAARALAARVAATGIENYARRGHRWPCGTHGGETPNLMLGLAGIGHFYLRMQNLAIPTVLILRSESFSQAP